MPEQFCICLLFETLPPSRLALVTTLLRAAAYWFGEPTSLITIDVVLNETIEMGWPPPISAIEGHLGERLFVISTRTEENGQCFQSRIVIQESDAHALYITSIDLARIRGQFVTEIEKILLNIFEAALAVHRCAMFVGAELDFESSATARDLLLQASDPASLIRWIVVPGTFVLPDLPSFDRGAVSEHGVLLRHRDAAAEFSLLVK